MAANRVNELPEGRLFNDLADFGRMAGQLVNAPQRIGGASLIFRTSDTGSAYDWSGALPSSPLAPATGTKILRVTAEAQQMDHLFGDIIVWPLHVGSPSNIYRPSNYLAALESGGVGFLVQADEEVGDPSNRKKKSWAVTITGNTTTTVYFKAYVITSDIVTVTVQGVT